METTRRVHATDLTIESQNWIHAQPYVPTPDGLLQEAIDGLDINFEDFAFVDFGSGKGRVLLMASEFSFKQIIGVEFSSELHVIAQRNIASFKSASQKCRNIVPVCMDFTDFELPTVPLVTFLYNPASEEIIRSVARNIKDSMSEHPRKLWIVYVTPHEVFDSEQILRKVRVGEFSGHPYSVYTN